MTSTESPPTPTERRPIWGQPSSWTARAFTLFGLFGLGIAQPLLDLYGSNPEVFIANRSSTGQIVAFALFITLVPTALALGAIAIAQAISETAGRVATTVFLALGGFLAASAVLRQLLPDSNGALLLAGAATAGLLWLVARSDGVRTWLQLLAAVPVVALVSFFAFSDSSELVWESEASADESTARGTTQRLPMAAGATASAWPRTASRTRPRAALRS